MGKKSGKAVVTATNTGVVVGTGKHKWGNLRFVGLVVLVAVLAVGAGGAVSWWQHRHGTAKMDPVLTKALGAQDLAASGDYDQAVSKVQDALKDPNLTTEQKFTLQFQQGLNYENQQKYADALTWYKKAEATMPTEGSAQALARASAGAGDKSAAIAYYKKAIARISPNSPVKDSTKANYELQIQNLGGTP